MSAIDCRGPVRLKSQGVAEVWPAPAQPELSWPSVSVRGPALPPLPTPLQPRGPPFSLLWVGSHSSVPPARGARGESGGWGTVLGRTSQFTLWAPVSPCRHWPFGSKTTENRMKVPQDFQHAQGCKEPTAKDWA